MLTRKYMINDHLYSDLMIWCSKARQLLIFEPARQSVDPIMIDACFLFELDLSRWSPYRTSSIVVDCRPLCISLAFPLLNFYHPHLLLFFVQPERTWFSISLFAPSAMNLLSALVDPLRDQLAIRSTVAVIEVDLLSFAMLVVIFNVLHQIIFRKPMKPSMMFHWILFIDNIIVYDMNSYDFFFVCRKKICAKRSDRDLHWRKD